MTVSSSSVLSLSCPLTPHQAQLLGHICPLLSSDFCAYMLLLKSLVHILSYLLDPR
jgi:hypothetical protein